MLSFLGTSAQPSAPVAATVRMLGGPLAKTEYCEQPKVAVTMLAVCCSRSRASRWCRAQGSLVQPLTEVDPVQPQVAAPVMAV